MIILPYLNELINKLQDESIPNEGKLALGLFILITISTLSVINIIIYFVIIISIDKKIVQDKINEWKFLKRIAQIYKNTRIYFILFEVSLFLYIHIFVLWNCYRLISHFLI